MFLRKHASQTGRPRKRASAASALALLVCVFGSGVVRADDDPTPEHSAMCVAALQVEAKAMAAKLRDGQAEIEPELVKRVQQGFAFIGSAYKQGLRDPEANRMLKAAEQATDSLSAAELEARQKACRAEGTRLLENATMFERAFVTRAAQRRVDKLKRSSG